MKSVSSNELQSFPCSLTTISHQVRNVIQCARREVFVFFLVKLIKKTLVDGKCAKGVPDKKQFRFTSVSPGNKTLTLEAIHPPFLWISHFQTDTITINISAWTFGTWSFSLQISICWALHRHCPCSFCCGVPPSTSSPFSSIPWTHPFFLNWTPTNEERETHSCTTYNRCCSTAEFFVIHATNLLSLSFAVHVFSYFLRSFWERVQGRMMHQIMHTALFPGVISLVIGTPSTECINGCFFLCTCRDHWVVAVFQPFASFLWSEILHIGCLACRTNKATTTWCTRWGHLQETV